MKITIFGLLLVCAGYTCGLTPTPALSYIVNPLPMHLDIEVETARLLAFARAE
jgi:hypothetical protein